LSLRSCARRDPRQGGRAGAIAGKHLEQAPREMPQRQMPRQIHVHDLLNPRTWSLRSELLTTVYVAQENSAVQRRLSSAAGSAREDTRLTPLAAEN